MDSTRIQKTVMDKTNCRLTNNDHNVFLVQFRIWKVLWCLVICHIHLIIFIVKSKKRRKLKKQRKIFSSRHFKSLANFLTNVKIFGVKEADAYVQFFSEIKDRVWFFFKLRCNVLSRWWLVISIQYPRYDVRASYTKFAKKCFHKIFIYSISILLPPK